MSVNDDRCSICGGTLGNGYCRDPEIFGKRPGAICFACLTVPAQPPGWKRGDPKPLHSVEEMVAFGWDKREAKFHITAVKKYFKVRTPRTQQAGSKVTVAAGEAGAES